MHLLRVITVAMAVLLISACGGGITGERSGIEAPTARPVAEVAGQMTDGFAPDVDDRVAVVGVAVGGHLVMRTFPGVDQAVVARIPPAELDLFGFGQTFETEDDRTWWLVRWQDKQGWIEPGAAYLSSPEDISVQVAGTLSSSSYATQTELVGAVLGQFAPNPIIVEDLVDANSGTSSTTVDLIDVSEQRRGERLVISGAGSDGDWRIAGVQRISLCRRGLTEDGGCN